MSESVHPTAIVDPDAELAGEVAVGPYAVIEGAVRIGPGSRIAAHAVVRSHSILGENVSVDSFAVIGGPPQDLSFDLSTESYVRIGDGTVIREGVTVHRSTRPGGVTVIGGKCLLMANAHVAHDCQLGDEVVLANNAMLAGHVHVGDASFLGGGCGIHQFVRIGRLAMVAGNASVTCDVPSYLMVAERSLVTGLNLVGMKRRLSGPAIAELRGCYKSIYMKAGDPLKLAGELRGRCPEAREFLACFSGDRQRRVSRSRAQSRL